MVNPLFLLLSRIPTIEGNSNRILSNCSLLLHSVNTNKAKTILFAIFLEPQETELLFIICESPLDCQNIFAYRKIAPNFCTFGFFRGVMLENHSIAT